MNENFDRISELGFQITINWGDFININLELPSNGEDSDSFTTFSPSLPILMYYHPTLTKYKFSDTINHIVDEFNKWYGLNIDDLDNYKKTGSLTDKLVINGLGDITQIVQRKLKIENVIY